MGIRNIVCSQLSRIFADPFISGETDLLLQLRRTFEANWMVYQRRNSSRASVLDLTRAWIRCYRTRYNLVGRSAFWSIAILCHLCWWLPPHYSWVDENRKTIFAGAMYNLVTASGNMNEINFITFVPDPYTNEYATWLLVLIRNYVKIFRSNVKNFRNFVWACLSWVLAKT